MRSDHLAKHIKTHDNKTKKVGKKSESGSTKDEDDSNPGMTSKLVIKQEKESIEENSTNINNSISDCSMRSDDKLSRTNSPSEMKTIFAGEASSPYPATYPANNYSYHQSYFPSHYLHQESNSPANNLFQNPYPTNQNQLPTNDSHTYQSHLLQQHHLHNQHGQQQQAITNINININNNIMSNNKPTPTPSEHSTTMKNSESNQNLDHHQFYPMNSNYPVNSHYYTAQMRLQSAAAAASQLTTYNQSHLGNYGQQPTGSDTAVSTMSANGSYPVQHPFYHHQQASGSVVATTAGHQAHQLYK
jgi:hypothetical protein